MHFERDRRADCPEYITDRCHAFCDPAKSFWTALALSVATLCLMIMIV